MSGAAPDFKALFAKIPTSKDPADVAKRAEMFKQFDVSNDGLLSLAKVDKGIRDVLNIEEIFDAKPVIMRAFQTAKEFGVKHGISKHPDFVHKPEFRLLLVYIEEYFKIWEIFEAIDTSGERRISREELDQHFEKLKKWVDPKSAEEVWQSLTADGAHHILFTPFAHFAIPLMLKEDHLSE